jgi:hypothetical protein
MNEDFTSCQRAQSKGKGINYPAVGLNIFRDTRGGGFGTKTPVLIDGGSLMASEREKLLSATGGPGSVRHHNNTTLGGGGTQDFALLTPFNNQSKYSRIP